MQQKSTCGPAPSCSPDPATSLRRRRIDLDHDYEGLVAAQRKSWEINFPDDLFWESVFRSSVRGAARRGEVFVYERHGMVVGWLWLDLARPLAGVHIRHIQVAEPYWGRGYGRSIVSDAIAIAMDRGAPRLTLNVTKENARAMNLYEGLGFETIEDFGQRQRMSLELDAVDLL